MNFKEFEYDKILKYFGNMLVGYCDYWKVFFYVIIIVRKWLLIFIKLFFKM